ncbi:hypothetical protein H6A03_11565 [[Clostridium] spiroforme]|nr:hypothetical protein [Thomasclavelia spiroformis]MBM6881197.1 hypothetical protein [Thomasclavelia spiroformis]
MKQNKHKRNNSFLVVIKETQNNTWQGTIEWIEKNEKQSFRSALEMIKLIDSAIDDKS